jgi:hypothetical protein
MSADDNKFGILGTAFATLHRDAGAIPTGHIPAALTALAAAQSVLAARLLSAPATATTSETPEEELLGVEEAARRAKCSPSHLYRVWRGIPGAGKIGRRLVIPAGGLSHLVRSAE